MPFLDNNGPFNGVTAPIKQASRYFWPPHLFPGRNVDTITTTGARYYVVPFYVERAKTFAGAWAFNSGSGDNGDKIKIAAYNQSTSGGPGTLAKSFGEVTLTGASAVRTFASSWSASPGWYYMELVSDNAVALHVMFAQAFISSVGYVNSNQLASQLGVTTPTADGNFDLNLSGCEYVAGTYANFPEATSLTPTTTIYAQSPLFGLYT